MSLNKNETRIYEAIKEDPYVSQRELAKRMGLSRSYVAGILSNLVNNGYLLGRAYVLNPEKAAILCIGRIHRPPSFGELTTTSSEWEPRSATTHVTGSASLQIAEGLKRLQERVVVLRAVDPDTVPTALKDATRPFVDDTLTPDWLYKNSALLQQAGFIVIDSDLPSDIQEIIFTITRKANGMLLCVAPFGSRTPTISEIGAGVTLFVATIDQSQSFFSSSEMAANEQMTVLLRHSLKNGAEHVCLLDQAGSLYYGSYRYGLMKVSLPETTPHVATVGSQAALVAGMVHQYRQTKDLKQILTAGLVNTTLATPDGHNEPDDLNPHRLETAIHESGPLLFEAFV